MAAAAPLTVAAAGTSFRFEPLFEVSIPAAQGALGAAPRRAVWHRARAAGTAIGSPWDAAHAVARQASVELAARAGTVTFVEPDLIQEWPTGFQRSMGLGAAGDNFEDQDDKGHKFAFPAPRVFAWHLADSFSGLASARTDARDHKTHEVRIAHVDVGYGLQHVIFPAGFEPTLAKNVTGDGRHERDVEDLITDGVAKNPGHGTGTIGILAGGKFGFQHAGYNSFDDQIGAAPDAFVVGVRVGESVVQIRTSCVAQAIAYIADLCRSEDTRVHVLSMSMGGVASQAWADAVNLAYERGVVLVTAAGNNFSTGIGGVPTTSTIYPARFERVLSACGIMGNFKPYFGLGIGTMQGNWGPERKRDTSLSAFTPNSPWARRSSNQIVDMDGAGTSAATPQIAGAAALYVQKHGATLFDSGKYPQPWMRVEAVRAALIESARADLPQDDMKKLGSGVLQAQAALQIAPIPVSQLRKSPKADASFSFLHSLFGVRLAAGRAELDPMLQLEMAQLVQQWEAGDPADPSSKEGNPFDAILAAADQQKGVLTPAQQRDLARKLLSHPRASTPLRRALSQALGEPRRAAMAEVVKTASKVVLEIGPGLLPCTAKPGSRPAFSRIRPGFAPCAVTRSIRALPSGSPHAPSARPSTKSRGTNGWAPALATNICR